MDLDRARLAALHAAVEHGSLEAAARSLAVTPSAVSQRIKALENSTGQVLVRRTRPTTPTPAGEVLVRLAGQLALLEREAERELAPGAGGDLTLAVAVNADSLTSWFFRVLAPPDGGLPDGVVLDVRREDQDHSAALLRDGTVMAAVTADERVVQGCRSVPLGALRYLALASPSYVERRLAPTAAGAPDLTALDTAPLVAFDRKDALQLRYLREQGRHGAAPPVHHVPSSRGFVEAVAAGLGWGMVPELVAAEELAAGRLVELAPGTRLDVPLHWQHWRLDAPALAWLTSRVVAVAAAVLVPAAGRRRPARATAF